MELTGAWSMNREKLISTMEKRIKQIEDINFQFPSVSRLTDWSILIKTNYSHLKKLGF